MFYRLYSLSDIDMIVELKGSELPVSDLDLYAEAFKTVEMYDELAFLRLRNVNDSLLVAGGGHDNMAGGFIPSENMTPRRVLDTFLKHRAIGFYEKHGGRSETQPA